MADTISSSAPATTTVAVRYGLLLGLVSAIVSLTLLMLQAEQGPARWLSMAVAVGAIYLAHQEFKKQNGGFMSYSQGLGIGALMGLISGSLNALVTFGYTQFVDNSFTQRVLTKARADMEARGGMSDEQMDQALAMTAKFTTPTMLFVFGILGGAFFAFLLSLAISAFTKHTRPEFE